MTTRYDRSCRIPLGHRIGRSRDLMVVKLNEMPLPGPAQRTAVTTCLISEHGKIIKEAETGSEPNALCVG